jgi:arylsulfatase
MSSLLAVILARSLSSRSACSPRSMTALAILTVLAVVSQAIGAQELTASDQPNILVILADDLGYSDLGCYGGEIDTPHIDALAAGGVRFTQLYNSARCCPSRASLMTGLYPSQAGIGDFTTAQPSPTRGPGYLGRLNDQCVTLAEVLKPAGYGCYYVGKWHLHPETGPIRRGFDEFYGYTNDHSHDQYDADYYLRLPEGRTKEIDPPQGEFYATDVFNRYALQFIRQGQASGKPWFLFLGHSSPHFPVQAPADRADKYEQTYLRGWDVLREERYARMQQLGLIDGQRWTLTPRSIVPVDREDIANGYPGEPNPAWASLPEDRRRDLARRMAVFAAMVEGVDQGVGQILDHLRATGDLENTLILFLSDNGACYEWGPFGFDGVSRRGENILHTGDALRKIGGPGTHHSYGSAWANLGNTPFRLYKHFTHEGGISTPFIAHWPQGIGQVDGWVRQPSHVMDILPTILDASGARYPAEYQGRKITPVEGTSLLPVMRGRQLPERTIGFDHQEAHALRRGDWKIVWSKRMPWEIQWELYNLAEDRCETNDLAEKYPERVREMAAAWEQWARHVNVIYESGDAGHKSDSPLIANRPLTITGRVAAHEGVGVIVAQGGREHGYAVHLLEGRLAFDVRVHGQVTRIAAERTVPQAFDFRATLSPTVMKLEIDGNVVAEGRSPGLIPVQPQDALTIGRDELSAAGEYEAPNPLQGKIGEIKVTPGKVPAEETKPTVAPGRE